MTNFNIERLWRFTRWTFVTDLPYIRKTAASFIATMMIILQLPNLIYVLGGPADTGDAMAIGASVWMLLACLILGGSYMFLSFQKRKDGIREMNLLPASNLEKYLVRYIMYVIIVMILGILSLLIADALQYVVGMVVGRQPLEFITSRVCNLMTNGSSTDNSLGYVILALFVWVHTLFLLGANFFRNVKYSWVLTMIFLMLISNLFVLLFNVLDFDMPIQMIIKNHSVLTVVTLLVLSVLQVWLSYRLFCSRQYIGRFINWI